MKRLGTLALWWGFSALLPAAVLHVAPNGDDGGAGDSSKPFRTLAHALGVAGAGDSVELAEGTYREGGILLKRGGTKEQPLVVVAAPSAKVIISGADRVTGWEKGEREGVWEKKNWDVNSQQLFANGKPLQQIGAGCPFQTQMVPGDDMVCLKPAGRGRDDLKPGSFFYDPAAKTLSCLLPDKSDPNKAVLEASVRDEIIDGNGQSHVVLRGLQFEHSNGTARGTWSALVRVGGRGWVVEDCTFAKGDFQGIYIAGEDHVVRRSRFIGNGNSGIGLNGSDEAHRYEFYESRPPMNVVLDELLVEANNYRGFNIDWHAGGVKVIPAVRGVTVRRCTVKNNVGSGIWFDTNLGNNVIEDNVVSDNSYAGIFVEISEPGKGDSNTAIVRNNLVTGNGAQGIYISACEGVEVLNNTCSGNDWDIVVHGMPRRGPVRDMVLRNNTVRDNIVSGKEGDIVLFTGKDSGNNTLDGNYYSLVPGRPGIAVAVVNTGDYDATDRDIESLRKKGFEKTGSSGGPGKAAAGKGRIPRGNNVHAEP